MVNSENNQAVLHLKSVDRRLSSLIGKIGECGLDPGTREPFDVLASSIISQQLSAKASGTIKNRIVNLTGEDRPLRPTQLIKFDIDQLRVCGLSRAKSNYLISLAKNMSNGNLIIDEFYKMDNELVKQPGIGPWTSEMFLIFALGRPDILSLSDTGLRRADQKLYNRRRRLTDKQFITLSNKWRPYRSVASWYLWRYIDSM